MFPPSNPSSTPESPTLHLLGEAEVVNPQHWHDLAEIYVAAARKDNSDLSGLLIDIDATKAVNDEIGHQAGTELIDMVDGLAKVIPQQVRHDSIEGARPADVVTSRPSEPSELDIPGLALPKPQTARIGGDEFGILLPRTDKSGAQVVASRLLEALDEKLSLPAYSRLKAIGVGISIGIETFNPATMKTAADFLGAIDKSMYADKIERLPAKSPTEQENFFIAMKYLEKAGVRPRDVSKYLIKFGATALADAFEKQIETGEQVEAPDQTNQDDS